MKCHNCGSSDENERFCKQCGQVLREEPDIIDAQSRAESGAMTDAENSDYLQDGSNSEAHNLPPDYVYDRNDTVWIVILSIFVAIVIFLAILDEFME